MSGPLPVLLDESETTLQTKTRNKDASGGTCAVGGETLDRKDERIGTVTELS